MVRALDSDPLSRSVLVFLDMQENFCCHNFLSEGPFFLVGLVVSSSLLLFTEDSSLLMLEAG